jgi:hypothetical protein
MGFIRGVIAGVTVAAGAAAWYMSRAGAKFRDRYRVDRKLGQIGDEVEVRTRDVRAQVGAQVADARDRAAGHVTDARDRVTGGPADDVALKLDEAQAAAAEEAAELAASVEEKAAKIKKTAKAAEADAEG